MERTRRTTPHLVEALAIEPPPAVDLAVLHAPRVKAAPRNAWRAVDVRMGTDGPRPQTKNKRRRGRPHKRKR